jgi:hypothetical protein
MRLALELVAPVQKRFDFKRRNGYAHPLPIQDGNYTFVPEHVQWMSIAVDDDWSITVGQHPLTARINRLQFIEPSGELVDQAAIDTG